MKSVSSVVATLSDLRTKRRAYQRKVAVAEFEAVVSGDIDVLVPLNQKGVSS